MSFLKKLRARTKAKRKSRFLRGAESLKAELKTLIAAGMSQQSMRAKS